jgi:hypothetical protein
MHGHLLGIRLDLDLIKTKKSKLLRDQARFLDLVKFLGRLFLIGKIKDDPKGRVRRSSDRDIPVHRDRSIDCDMPSSEFQECGKPRLRHVNAEMMRKGDLVCFVSWISVLLAHKILYYSELVLRTAIR